MTTFAAIRGKELIAALKLCGFALVRVKGSHHFVRDTDGRATVVPVHAGETIGTGLPSRILRDGKLRREKLQKHL